MIGGQTMASWALRHAERTPAKIAFEHGAEKLDYAALDRRVREVAHGLVTLGVRRGDRVALLLFNGLPIVELIIACTHLGVIAVPLNFRLSADELAFMVADAAPELVVFSAQLAPVVAEVRTRVSPAVRWMCADGAAGVHDIPYQALATGHTIGAASVSEEDPALMMYTSGTTGQPKGALLSHGNLLWNNLQLLTTFPAREDDRNYNAAPLFHIGGLNVLTGPLLYLGATTVIDEKFEPRRALEAISTRGITCAFMVPAMWAALTGVPEFETTDLSGLRFASVGGAPCPLPVLERYAARGIRFQEGFGMTETSPIVCVLAARDGIRKAGSVGQPAMHVEVRIVDDADRDVPPGEAGELIIRGPNITRGYWNRVEETAITLRGGWLHSGDIARRDEEGYLYIVDRKKDVVITGGENVYSAEVEQVLFRHPAVADVAVIGLPDPRWGEAVTAVVVLVPGSPEPALADLVGHCDGKLARYKQPRAMHLVEALPRNATGKVQKAELRRRFTGSDSAVNR